MKEVKVSIIIPVYNVEKYLKQCLNSAINQRLKEIEIIAVNDGSTDNSLNILREYENKFKNFIIINQENKGLSGARNSGLKVAKGEYVYFLDSDDYISEELCENCYKECKNNRLDIIMFDAEVFYDENSLKSNHEFDYDRHKKLQSEVINGINLYEELLRKDIYRSQVCTYFYKREFLIKNNIKFYSGILHEDELFTAKVLLLCEYIKYIPEKFFFRRVRSNSIMTSGYSFKNAFGYYTVAKKLNEIYKTNKYSNSIIKKNIDNFYFIAINIAKDCKDDKKSRELILKIKKAAMFDDITLTTKIKILCPSIFKLIKKLK